MPETGASAAVTEATRLPEIGFAQFTSKLITDVFAALIDANLKQVAAYMELVNAMATSLKDFISSSITSITIEEVRQFLASVLPNFKLEVGQPLIPDDVNKLNVELALPPDAGTENKLNHAELVDDAGKLTQNGFDKIVAAVRRRLATNRYNMLREMVRQGVLRLVVDNGIIETRLTFSTYGYTSWAKNKYKEERGAGAAGGVAGGGLGFGAGGGVPGFGFGGGYGGGGLGGAAGVGMTVSTTRESNRDVNGSSVQIYGRVEIRFKTDYVPLAP